VRIRAPATKEPDMHKTNSVVAVYATHPQAEETLRAFRILDRTGAISVKTHLVQGVV
jgi:hypothetical protein